MDKTPHKHAALIAEAVQDLSRKIEGGRGTMYEEVTLSEVVGCTSGSWVFRFADTVKPEVTSPMSDGEIDAIWWSLKPVGNEMPSHHEIGRTIAIAAKIATIREVAAMAFDTSTGLECNGGGFSAAAMSQFAGACVAEFQQKLLAGIGETK